VDKNGNRLKAMQMPALMKAKGKIIYQPIKQQ